MGERDMPRYAPVVSERVRDLPAQYNELCDGEVPSFLPASQQVRLGSE